MKLSTLTTLAVAATLLACCARGVHAAPVTPMPCLKPLVVVHKHKTAGLPVAPVQSCIASVAPLFAAPEEEIPAAVASPHNYYVVLGYPSDCAAPVAPHVSWWSDWGSGSTFRAGGSTGGHVAAPEIDTAGLLPALTLLIGTLAVLRGRK